MTDPDFYYGSAFPDGVKSFDGSLWYGRSNRVIKLNGVALACEGLKTGLGDNDFYVPSIYELNAVGNILMLRRGNSTFAPMAGAILQASVDYGNSNLLSSSDAGNGSLYAMFFYYGKSYSQSMLSYGSIPSTNNLYICVRSTSP
ncbi:MAG: hypothetical protein V4724_24010 [Pseudomonadota bacterium]